ncbi:9795_t:CDS:2 [Paraglomus occultum]|uniref:9795_t:CDS:1 n=1 Tax=Paraglomus occultum TaxID=144539 RepID=A0A9N9GG10_9GLOM|nr:9795_t:CDS:2 [Paraglomus occultum]
MSKPPNVLHDKSASLFLPKEFQNYTCGYASPDGSQDYYLGLPIFQSYWAWSNEVMLADNDANEKYLKAAYYKMELKHMCSQNSYSPLLALYGLSEVIKNPIQSILIFLGRNHVLELKKSLKNGVQIQSTQKLARTMIEPTTHVGELMAGLDSLTNLNTEYEMNTDKIYPLADQFISVVQKINRDEANAYLTQNGKDAEKRSIRGYTQRPVEIDPLSVSIYNEASLHYYHHFASQNPGVFIDYTGLMIQDIDKFFSHQSSHRKECKPNKILNTIITIPTGNSRIESEAPPALIAEYITTDFSADHLA